jgi:hypothetical protein
MNKFATKAVSTLTMLGIMAGSVAAMVPVVDNLDTYYPAAPVNGVRLEIEGDRLQPLVVDFNLRDGVKTLQHLGVAYVYGNEKDDNDGANSFDTVTLDASFAPDGFGVIIKNTSNSSKTVYDMVYVDGFDVYKYTETNKNPGTSLSSVRSLLVNEAPKGGEVDYGEYSPTLIAPVNLAEAIETFENVLNGMLAETIGAGTVRKGDPDVMTSYFDELWVYAVNADNEGAWHTDLQLSNTKADFDTAEVSSVKVVARGTHGRVDIVPGNMTGVAGFQVEITNGAGDDYDFTTAMPVVFFDAVEDTRYDVTVYTINGRGQTSSDGFEVERVDSDRVDMTQVLLDTEGSTFYNHIQYLYKLGIVDGYSNGNFGADDTVTRGQLSKFVMNAFRLPYNMGGMWFSDVKPSDTFGPYIQSLKNAGVIGGFSDGTFRADEAVTRGQATKFIFEAANYFVDEAVELSSCNFNDKAQFGVFAGYICGLAEHSPAGVNADYIERIIGGYSNGNFGPNDNLTRGQMSKIILNAGSLVMNVDGDPYLTDGNKDRGFVAPVKVEDFEVEDRDDSTVILNWMDLSSEDGDIDGFIIERKESGYDRWEGVDVANGFDYNPYTFGDVIDPSTNRDGWYDVGTITTDPVQFVDTGLRDNTSFNYRIAAMKWVEPNYADRNYVPGDGAARDQENMIIGPWVELTTKTLRSI